MRPLIVLLAFAVNVAADEEFPPPPRILPAPPPANLFLAPVTPRTHGTMDFWNNYSTDQFGRWRPRVIAAPFGSYYYYNGQPYPWTTTHPNSWRTLIRD
jgi:hypothetical protein